MENFRDTLTCGDSIGLDEAFDIYLKKPHRQKFNTRVQGMKRSIWNDFSAFLKKTHPECKEVGHVTHSMAGEYIAYTRSEGRFVKTVYMSRGRKTMKYTNYACNLSTSTVNRYLKVLKEMFDCFEADSGLQDNPFSHIKPLRNVSEAREAFTIEELQSIMENASDFVKDIFVVGFFTALRRADIVTLKWDEINWDKMLIRKKMAKVGRVVEIPIMPQLESFLRSRMNNGSEYVLPEQAEMFLSGNDSGVTYRVKKTLEELGITSTKKVNGRYRKVSTKDIHCLRHTFCYFAGLSGIPLIVVQSIVGHMTPEMTAHYSEHADIEAKRKMMGLFPSLPCSESQTALSEGNGILLNKADVRNSLSKRESDGLKKLFGK